MPMTTDHTDYHCYCLNCGAPIQVGRTDRKFCSDRCRSRYWNRIRYPKRENKDVEVLRILDRNRDILAKLVRMGISSIDLRSLQQIGYDPDYLTSYKKVGTKRLCTCFDYMFELTPTRLWRIASIQSGKADKKGAQPGTGSAAGK